MVEAKGGDYRTASLTTQILNGDFNEDGHPDAAVVLYVIYNGIGYFSRILFVVLYDKANGPFVTNGVHLSIATYQIDLFSLDSTGKRIIVGYMSRYPGQPKAAAPIVPTILHFEVKDKKLTVVQQRVIQTVCYNLVVSSTYVEPNVTCPTRSFIQEGKCVEVSSDCDKYDTVTGKCITCIAGANFESGYCIRTSKNGSGGKDSSNSPASMTCPFRTVPKDGNCVQVSDQCKDWDRVSGDCTKCYDGYNLRTGKCNR
jgi:hypothetical protein